jgi:hypothetical protein
MPSDIGRERFILAFCFCVFMVNLYMSVGKVAGASKLIATDASAEIPNRAIARKNTNFRRLFFMIIFFLTY